jgi:UDP-N-acetylglucosamine 1-carboxyvinyltransferase
VHKFLIVGGNRLKGTIRASGSKNAALPVLAACILNASKNTIHEVPRLKDVAVMKDVLTYLGAKVVCEGNTFIVDSSNIQSVEISEDLMRRIVLQILYWVPCSAGSAGKNIYPGGCQIGSRP